MSAVKRPNPTKAIRPAKGGPSRAPAAPHKPGPTTAVPAPSPAVLDATELQRVALLALRDVALATDAPSAAKAAAARTLLEYTGGIGRHAEPPATVTRAKPLAEMTLEELDAAIAAHGSD